MFVGLFLVNLDVFFYSLCFVVFSLRFSPAFSIVLIWVYGSKDLFPLRKIDVKVVNNHQY